MRPTVNAALVASALALGGLLGVGTTSAQAQAPGNRPPAARPAPAPAPKPRVSTWKKFTNFFGDIFGEDTGKSTTHKDPFTGRDELPGSKPWSQSR